MARQLDRLKRMTLSAEDELAISDAELEEVYDFHTSFMYDVALKELKDPSWQFPQHTLAWDIVTLSGAYTFSEAMSIVTFTDSVTRSSVVVPVAKVTDINLAAAEVWRRKAGRLYNAVDASSDNHSMKLSQQYLFCMQQARYYTSISQSAFQVAKLVRTDLL